MLIAAIPMIYPMSNGKKYTQCYQPYKSQKDTDSERKGNETEETFEEIMERIKSN